MEHEPFTVDDLDEMVLGALERRRLRRERQELGGGAEDETPFARQLREFTRRRQNRNGPGRLPTP